MTQDDPRSSAMSERMRALLSRAAEEQLSEQRQVSAILGDLRALVADVDDRLRALELHSAGFADAVADRVLERAADTLVPQLTAAVLAAVREVTDDAQRRTTAHVDEAVLALAEALLRRRRGSRAGDPPEPDQPLPTDSGAGPDGTGPAVRALLLEDVLDLLAGLLEVAGGLVLVTLSLELLVAGRPSDVLLALSAELLRLVLQLVHVAHGDLLSSPKTFPGCASRTPVDPLVTPGAPATTAAAAAAPPRPRSRRG